MAAACNGCSQRRAIERAGFVLKFDSFLNNRMRHAQKASHATTIGRKRRKNSYKAAADKTEQEGLVETHL